MISGMSGFFYLWAAWGSSLQRQDVHFLNTQVNKILWACFIELESRVYTEPVSDCCQRKRQEAARHLSICRGLAPSENSPASSSKLPLMGPSKGREEAAGHPSIVPEFSRVPDSFQLLAGGQTDGGPAGAARSHPCLQNYISLMLEQPCGLQEASK